MHRKMAAAAVACLTSMTLVYASDAKAQARTYPNKPVQVVVPFAAGGGTDVLTRLIAKELSELWEQPAVIVNRGGAGSTLGTGLVAKATADGYTILFNSSGIAPNVTLFQPLRFDLLRDLAPVSQLAKQSNVLVINPMVPAKTVGELIQLAKAKPRGFTIGSGGGAAHLATELFRSMSGAKVEIAHYKGGGQALAALMSGDVQMLISTMSDALPHINSGRIKALGVTASERSPIAPDLPTLSEAGLTGYEYSTWYGVFCPAGVPRSIITQLNRDIAHALATPGVRKRFAATGVTAAPSTPDEFGRYVRAQVQKWRKVIETAGLKK
ncbi:MAG: tripartite tricarboxylate transporter substrate binding protein [Betaproteobacteria bacterium]|nr:tripartite tricarboxylate transporter substrate binding protein [Betaproteobacteria bacterium]